MPNSETNTFAIRRLNPFNGVLQVATSADGRALSSNGVNWEIQVLGDSPQGLWANIPCNEKRYYTFGLWSLAEGLHKVPLNPLFNIRDMLDSAQRLIESLEPRLEALPFPLADDYELWLLDEVEGTPIALLESARSEAEMRQKRFRPWSAAASGEFGFVSRQLWEQGLPTDDGHNPRVHASLLESLVRKRCGQNHRRAWLLRDAKENGHTLEDDSRVLPPEWFPELPVSLDWRTPEELRLIEDYIAWKAPHLLLLPDLTSATRSRLERLAVMNAAEIDRLWRLFPEIHDKPLLNKARVEAKIRLSNRT